MAENEQQSTNVEGQGAVEADTKFANVRSIQSAYFR
jgi:hypothetical protein